MNKIIKKLFISILVLCILPGCSLESYNDKRYSDWQKITIDTLGTFRAPSDWVYTVTDDGAYYFTDKPIKNNNDYKIYLVGTIISEDTKDNIDINQVFDNVEFAEGTDDVAGNGLENSATYGGVKSFIIDQAIAQKQYISFYNHGTLTLYNWNDLVDANTMKEIAKSYSNLVTQEKK